jgi:glyoxylate reductase
MSLEERLVSDTIFVTRRIFDETLNYLAEHVVVEGNDTDRVLSSDELQAGAADAAGILSMVTDRIDSQLMDSCPNLKMVANFAVGFNNVDLDAASERGILVTNTPGVLTETTADFAWALLMAAARRIVEGDRLVRDGKFTAWGPRMLLGHDVHRKTLGLIGMGRIGQAVARRARGFDMDVIFYDPYPVPAEVVDKLGARSTPLEELYRTADFISVHVPLLPDTHHLLDDDAFAQIKPNAVVVNTSRGPVVDEQALVRALEAGTIAAAGIDVFEHEPQVEPGLLALDNVVLAPHIASGSHDTRLRMSMLASENLVCGLRGDRPPNLVNTEAWEQRKQ